MNLRIAAVLGVASTSALAGCSSSGSGGGSSQHQRIVVGDAADGSKVTLHPGDTLVVQLHSTYWQVAAPSNGTLTLSSRKVVPTPPGKNGCVAGAGCGTVTATFRAVKTGTATVAAHRTSCGEALRCTGSSGSYSIGVVVP